jgi:Maf1 regulator
VCICVQIWDSTPGYSDCSFADSLWSAMDEAICLPECDVYSYKSDGEDDPFGALPNHLQHAAAPLCALQMLLKVTLSESS